MNEVQSLILRAATYAMSATAIANKIGKSKACQISDDLEALVEAGKLAVDTSGRYPLYKTVRAKTNRTSNTTTVATTSSNNNNSIVADGVSADTKSIPEGYSVSKLGKRKSDGLVGRKVTLPNGSAYFVESGDTLVNINDGDDVRIITSKNGAMPEAQISTLIEQYTKNNGMTAYTIKSKCGCIGRDNTIGVLDYKIQKCNKAA
jgi:hypothetical protein